MLLKTLKAICVVSTVVTGGAWILYTLEKDRRQREIYEEIVTEIMLRLGLPSRKLVTKDMIIANMRTKLAQGSELVACGISRRTGRPIRSAVDFKDVHTIDDARKHFRFVT